VNAKHETTPAIEGKHVEKITLADGVVGLLASDVPAGALEGLQKKLETRLLKLEEGAHDEG